MRCGRRRVTGVRGRKESDSTADRGAGAKLATVLGRNRGTFPHACAKYRNVISDYKTALPVIKCYGFAAGYPPCFTFSRSSSRFAHSPHVFGLGTRQRLDIGQHRRIDFAPINRRQQLGVRPTQRLQVLREGAPPPA